MKKHILKFLTLFSLSLLLLTGMTSRVNAAPTAGSWSVYIYLCGSNLESEYGAATADLNEIASCEFPDGLTVVVQTGGASSWQNDIVNPDLLERYVFQNDTGWCDDQQPLASMGDESTFADFLRFCHGNYPAEHEAVILWDHGGGTASGVAFDELFGYDALTLSELYEGFTEVYTEDAENPPLELVGFDACLMATIDNANMLYGLARYMTASEESEPGCGWNYQGFLERLSGDLSVNGAAAGRMICDTYMAGCREAGDSAYATLSVVDLMQAEPLLLAYDQLGSEALLYACEDKSFFASFGRGAEQAENFGGNTASAGYSNLVDLGDLVKQNRDLLPETSQDVLDALKACVTYRVNGPFRSHSTGLSCYYSYNGDPENYSSYSSVCASESFDIFYGYMLNGSLDEETLSWLSEELGYEGEPQEYTDLTSEETMEDLPLYLDEDGYAVLEVSPEALQQVKEVSFMLSYYDTEEDIMLLLGSDNDIEQDWEQGIFRDHFRGVWGAIDGHICYMEVMYSSEDYTFYNVPILLNGEEYQMKVIYDYGDEEFRILGANRGLDDTGMADRNTVQLQAGDVISTLLYAATVSGDDGLQLVDVEEFTISDDPVFGEEELGDGDFLLQFVLSGARDEQVWSEAVSLTYEAGNAQAEIVD